MMFSCMVFILSLGSMLDLAAGEECLNAPASPSIILRRRLFCNYDKNIRPTTSLALRTRVEMHLWLKHIHFAPELNALEVHSWAVLKWVDVKLSWDPSEYNGLDEIDVPGDQIWVPSIDTNSPSHMSDLTPRFTGVKCNLNSTGKLVCVAPTVNSAACDADIRRWPFDTHNCTMRLVAWSNHGLELKLSESGLTTIEYTENRDWILLNSSAVDNVKEFSLNGTNFTLNWAMYSFVLQRHSGGHAATVFIPSLGFAILALLVFWMESSSERLCLICLNILCHVSYLQYLGVNLPPNGDKYPIILLFYRDSLLMVGVSLVISLVVRTMNAASSVPPPWITSLIDILPSHVMLGGGSVEEEKKWRRCGVLIDRISFLCYFLTFFVLLTAYIP